MQIGDFNNTLLEIKTAISIDPYFDKSYWMLAKAYSAKGLIGNAMSTLRLLESYFGYDFEVEKFELIPYLSGLKTKYF